MNRITRYILPLFMAAFVLLQACNEMDDNYSSNPDYRLSFSTDTLSFDTIFSTVGSTTRQFMIYNQNKEALNMEQVMLASDGASGFRISVDGRKGTAFGDIGILGKDSMYVFVEVTVNPTDRNQPLLIRDSIVFRVNGREQTVLLEAYGQDVHLYKDGYAFTTDTFLPADRPYLIYDSLVIGKGVTATVEQGAGFYFHNKANLIVHGTLKAKGTLDAPILFRGDRLDDMIDGTLPYDRIPAQWGGITFTSNSYENEFDHVIVRNGTTGLTFHAADPTRSKLTMNNSQVTNMDGNLFSAVNCQMDIINSELSNASGVIASLQGGRYQFTHCTLANYMTMRLRNDTIPYTLLLTSTLPGGQTGAVNARFDNCIIDGSHPAGDNQVKSGECYLDNPGAEVAYLFNHCVMKMKGSENEQFANVTFVDKSPAYRMLGGKDNDYMYDFRLDSTQTTGVGMADPLIATEYPIDRYGVNRLTSEHGPTIGAYEFVPKEEEEE